MATRLNTLLYKWLLDWQSSVLLSLQLVLVGVICVSLVIAVFRYQNTVFLTIEPKQSATGVANLSKKFLAKEIKPLSFYMDLVEQRDIFHFGTNVANSIFATPQSISPTGISFASRYIVQGIIFDKNSQVIIKDTQGGKVYFVHLNETLDGATLVNIRDNQVIFNLAGETLELIKK